VLNLFADLAVRAGTACVNLSAHHTEKRDVWLERAEFWSDVGKWLRLRCVKSFADIRAERKAAKP
jgi:hypothetical protein